MGVTGGVTGDDKTWRCPAFPSLTPFLLWDMRLFGLRINITISHTHTFFPELRQQTRAGSK